MSEAGGGTGGWRVTAALLAAVPFAGVLSLQRVFHLRDLSLFWGRYLWLRRSLWSGEWPLWDPYVGGGQSAVADGLHQMFLLPSLLARFAGTEVTGFNLWVALPFPLAALGAYTFFRSRFSAPGSALGATVFAVSGPVVSSGNFPNLSWSIAAMPWVLWAADHFVATGGARAAAVLAVACACQILAGEPVTMTATALTALVFAAWPAREGRGEGDEAAGPWRPHSARVMGVAGALLLGLATAAIQVLPMAAAVSDSWRPYGRVTDFWSFHPLGLVETVSLQVFGNYSDATLLSERPWMAALSSGRDPFFYSVYLGPAALALAAFGAVASSRRRWARFWVAAGAVALVGALGAFTPIYPFLQAHVPLLKSFRYPVKYLLIAALAVSALVAGAWDGLTAPGSGPRARRRFTSGMSVAVALAASVGLAAFALAVGPLWNAHGAARWFNDLAVRIGATDPVACAGFALSAVPPAATRLSLVCAVVLALLVIRWKQAATERGAVAALAVLAAADLVVAAWGINPMMDARLMRQPAWAPIVAAHPETRFYLGGRTLLGAFDEKDPDAATSFVRPSGLTPVEGRSVVAAQSVFYPSAWGMRELFSFDLPVLWPRPLMLTHARFLRASADERDRFLRRSAVRFRIVSPSSVSGRTPLAELAYFQTLCLYDWGPGLTRAYVAPGQVVVADTHEQIERLFAPGDVDSEEPVVTAVSAAPAVGATGSPGSPAARIVEESANRVRIEATAGPGGGFLVLLDTFSPGWTATVDGQRAVIYRGNALFRTVPLVPGPHRVEFRYRPWSFQAGGAISLAGLLGIILLARRRG